MLSSCDLGKKDEASTDEANAHSLRVLINPHLVVMEDASSKWFTSWSCLRLMCLMSALCSDHFRSKNSVLESLFSIQPLCSRASLMNAKFFSPDIVNTFASKAMPLRFFHIR